MSRRRGKAANVCGALNLDKPAGMTSHDAVQQLRRLFGTSQVGHTGTLDPDASGVLPILLGSATRFAEFLQHLGKTYRTVARLGVVTDTQDAGGQVLDTSDLQPDPEAVQAALLGFLGEGEQVPPMYSAVRIDGRRLYELAREGKSVERPPRRIHVDSIDEIQYQYPSLSFRITVSSGTYIRTICHDLGQELGCGAVMAELRRVGSGPFTLDSAFSLEELGRRCEQERHAAVLSLEEIFAFLPEVRVLPDAERRVGHGQQVGRRDLESLPALGEGQRVRILALDGRMLAMGESRRQDGLIVIAPVRVLPERMHRAPQNERRTSEAVGLRTHGQL
jgi:tRNA pseudouridine55 synthase